MRRWLIGSMIGLLIVAAGLAIGLSPLGSSFEQAVGLPWLFRLRGSTEPPQDVVVVAIDGRTGEKLDLPPLPRDWPRSVHAQLTDELAKRGASVIVFDVHFGRPKDQQSDQVFVDAVAAAGNVVLVELLTGKRQPITDSAGRNVGMVWAEELIPPFAALADAARGLATFPLPKEDASVSQFWAFKQSTDQAPTLPAVALQLYARAALPALLERVRSASPETTRALPKLEDAFKDARQLRNLMRGLRDIVKRSPKLSGPVEPASANASIGLEAALMAMYAGGAHRFVNFYGPPGSIRNVPFHAVLKGADPNVPAEALDFSNQVVFVGYADLYDPGQPDRFYTVFTREDGVDLSGVEIAATSFANLLTNRALTPARLKTAGAILTLFGIVMGAALYLLPGYVGIPFALLFAAFYALVAQYVFGEFAIILPVATPLLVQAPSALIVGLFAQYRYERQRGQRISEAINYYLPEDIARDLAQNRFDPGKLNQVVYSTCLATDMAGFSTIAEQLPPGELAQFLNDYFETLAAPLKRHGVQVTEFRADAIMCAWTAEQTTPEPRRLAVLAALEAGEAIKDFRQRHKMPGARLRIGLEAGWVYVGHAGGGGRFVYSIVGDSANTASRVEGLNKHVGTQILATGNVVLGFENLVMRYLGDFQFVGKTDAIPIYEILARRETAGDQQLALCEGFDAGLRLYREADWSGAAQRFQRILDEFADDGPSRFFLERCQRYLHDAERVGDPLKIRMDAK